MSDDLVELRAALLRAGNGGDVLARARAIGEDLRERTSLVGLVDLLEALCREAEGPRRQLVRFGYDLHDAPLQEIAALGTDLHLFRDQLAKAVEGHEHSARLLGRVDDLLARLVGTDTGLRELAMSAESSALLRRPLSVTVREAVETSAKNASCPVELVLDPELDSAELTASQRIAIVRIIQGALANVIQHSGATNAQVSVSCAGEGIDAEISDNGCGFLVQPTLRHAAEAGRIGLVGMRERVRLLGGEFALNSTPGGPTIIRLRLPHWHPPSTP